MPVWCRRRYGDDWEITESGGERIEGARDRMAPTIRLIHFIDPKKECGYGSIFGIAYYLEQGSALGHRICHFLLYLIPLVNDEILHYQMGINHQHTAISRH